ncbi:H+-ATPase family protein [Hibiscus syriacus]|uniref:H+-ATPase family protein n=1 Tax=Hibiscus syriacus TaxID=106335 RepID=A0A6A3A6G2_HIBSY|nr:H+-ATPase family protein [Hibiscus syriacus]
MVFSSWICSKNTRNMFVKIVHPGGHVELHDWPILAAEIIHRNPRCVVAHPHVFQQPWAIVAPETELMLGQKFYVVPISTIRKLQRLSNKYSSTPIISESQQSGELTAADIDDSSSICWFFTNRSNKTPYSRMNSSPEVEDSSADSRADKGISKDGSSFDDKSCFACMKTSVKSSNDYHKADDGDDSVEETRSPGNLLLAGDDRTRVHMRKRVRGHAKGSTKRQQHLINGNQVLKALLKLMNREITYYIYIG